MTEKYPYYDADRGFTTQSLWQMNHRSLTYKHTQHNQKY